MKAKLLEKRMDLSRLSEWKRNNLKNQQMKDALTRKYGLHNVDIKEAMEILKQEIAALKLKIARYTTRCEFYRQNKLFETNQKRFYDQLDKKETKEPDKKPNKKKVLDFWSKIWGRTKQHNRDTDWISELREKNSDNQKQNRLIITTSMIKKAIKKMKNWRAAGPDGIQGYWIKNLTSLHERLAIQLQAVLEGNIPEWMATGKTTLIIKDPANPTKESNYRPITCLPTIWKLLTSIIADEIYTFLDNQKLIPWQQKGNKRKSRGTKDQLLIDKLITTTAKRRHRNLRMVWIDYRKAYDSVPHSWIVECLKMYGIAENIITFIVKSMTMWKTELQLNQETIGIVQILCGIFQGDSLSPLLFVIALIPLTELLKDSKLGFKIGKDMINHLLLDDLKLYGKNDKEIDALVNTVRIFTQDINMEFGLDKCAKVTMNRGKLVEGEGIMLPKDMEIRNLDLDESYKYLGLLECDQIKSKEMKEKAKLEYKKRVRSILQSKLHGRNQISAINTYAVPVITYLAGIVKFTVEEKRKLDIMTRKQLTMHGSLHPRADADRLYVPRKSGGRGLLSIEDAINKEENSIAFYVKNTDEPILKQTHSISLNSQPEPLDDFADKISHQRKSNWTSKSIHGVWPKNMEKFNQKTNDWLRKSNLKPATESLIMSAQDQALNTNWHKANILKCGTDESCRRCKQHKETVAHIVSGCPELAQTVYLHRHNAVASYLHWKLCGHHDLPRKDQWYEHVPEK